MVSRCIRGGLHQILGKNFFTEMRGQILEQAAQGIGEITISEGI